MEVKAEHLLLLLLLLLLLPTTIDFASGCACEEAPERLDTLVGDVSRAGGACRRRGGLLVVGDVFKTDVGDGGARSGEDVMESKAGGGSQGVGMKPRMELGWICGEWRSIGE